MHIAYKNKKVKPFFIFVVCFLCFSLGLSSGYLLFREKKEKVEDKGIDNKTLRQVYSLLTEKFYDTNDHKTSLNDRLIKGMVDGVEDKHTSYMTSSQFKSFDESVNGKYVGIGIHFVDLDEGALITNVFKDSGAYQAGLLPGDIITEVSGIKLSNKTSQERKEMIRGEENSLTTLTLKSKGSVKNIKVTRKKMDSSLFYQVITQDHKKIGYIEMSTFGDTTSKLFKKALEKFSQEKVDTLIIDLRDNGGGYIQAAEECLSYLCEKGSTLYQIKSRQNHIQKIINKEEKKYSFSQGMILVNNETASSSEIMATALSENNHYQVIGAQTYGKSTIQIEQPLANGGVLKYTYASWLTSKGHSVKDKGVSIDVKTHRESLSDLDLSRVTKTLKQDDLTKQVQSMEIMLQVLGYAPSRIDGYFSPKVSEALKAFQKKEKIKETGEYNTETYYHLVSTYLIRYQQLNQDTDYLKAISLIS